MRRSAGLLRLLACAAIALAAAGPARTAAAQTTADCEARRRSCVAECRAQHFSIDPKRGACIADCAAEANRCMRERAERRGEDAGLVSFLGVAPEGPDFDGCCRVGTSGRSMAACGAWPATMMGVRPAAPRG